MITEKRLRKFALEQRDFHRAKAEQWRLVIIAFEREKRERLLEIMISIQSL